MVLLIGVSFVTPLLLLGNRAYINKLSYNLLWQKAIL